ncbi:hypothetical protein B4Q13_23550 [Lacticaseibacillus rhamnosus]
MSSNAIDVKVTGAIGTIVLNRPERRNALTRAMLAQLGEALDDLHLEKRVRAIVLTGAGLKKCIPTAREGAVTGAAIAVTSSEEALRIRTSCTKA